MARSTMAGTFTVTGSTTMAGNGLTLTSLPSGKVLIAGGKHDDDLNRIIPRHGAGADHSAFGV